MQNALKLINLQDMGVNVNPFTDDFSYYVLYKFLFNGTAMKPIEDSYGYEPTSRGFDASRVLDYFKIPNTADNKNFYAGFNVSEVGNFLISQQNVDYKKIGEALLKIHSKKANIDSLTNFKDYYNRTLLQLITSERDYILNRDNFTKDYPIERINTLSLEEYALGGLNRKSTLCYKLEYGEYKNAGPSIGGGTSAKFGIYQSSDTYYYGRRNQKIDNPEEYWQNLKYQLYLFLKNFGDTTDTPINVSKKYPLLGGMSAVITKLLYNYYPEMVLNICSKSKLYILMKYFGYECDNNMSSEELSFSLNKNIRRDIPEVNNNDSQYLGSSLWHFIDNVINDNEENVNTLYKKYTSEDFLNDVFMNKPEYDSLKNLLETKKNIILQGPPGVGKSYTAKKLAYSIMGKKDDSKILSVQFHQSYSYEDFIEGIRPNKDNIFKLKDGIFKEFCNIAKEDKKNNYYCIIDEINRGNLSKILGELMLLIECNKRESEKLILPYSGEIFFVPENIFIIGMMNTADRSLALVDYALRRRFSFYELAPAFNKQKFKEYLINSNGLNTEDVNRLCARFNKINTKITEDLNEGFRIGHSYFVDSLNAESFKESYDNIIRYEILPLLKEYWIDDEEKVKEYSDLLW